METIQRKVMYSVIGMSGGMAGLSRIGTCTGTGCPSCFGCAGMGVLLILLALWKRKENKDDGMAENND